MPTPPAASASSTDLATYLASQIDKNGNMPFALLAQQAGSAEQLEKWFPGITKPNGQMRYVKMDMKTGRQLIKAPPEFMKRVQGTKTTPSATAADDPAALLKEMLDGVKKTYAAPGIPLDPNALNIRLPGPVGEKVPY